MNNLRYSFRELKKSWIFKVIVFIQITIAITLLYRVNEIKNYENGKLNLMSIITKDKTIYSMTSKYQSIEEFIKASDDPNKFPLLFNDIEKKHKLVVVTYGELVMKNFSGIDRFIDNELNEYNQEDGYKIINSLQTTSNFFDSFGIDLTQGDLNEFIDFTKLKSSEMNEKAIPIILGNSYKGIFKINDIIETKYKKCKVVGFLEKNQFYLDKGLYEPTRAKNLNTFIIIPTPKDIAEANLNSALLVNDNKDGLDFYSIQKEIDNIAEKYDVEISISDPKKNIDNFVEIVSYNANMKILIVYVVMLFVVIGLLAIFSNRINARRKEFSLHIMHGATYKDIYIRVILEHLYLLILSTVVSIYYLQKTKTKVITDIINFDVRAFGQTILLIFAIIFIIAMINIHNISRNRLNYLIKGE